MDSEPKQDQRPGQQEPSWPTATKLAFIWTLIAGVLAGCFALMDELLLPQPYDNLAEALVVIAPLSVPVAAGLWHRSWRVVVLLLAALLVLAIGVVGVVFLAMLGSGWAK